jgi:hypothetical protein
MKRCFPGKSHALKNKRDHYFEVFTGNDEGRYARLFNPCGCPAHGRGTGASTGITYDYSVAPLSLCYLFNSVCIDPKLSRRKLCERDEFCVRKSLLQQVPDYRKRLLISPLSVCQLTDSLPI